jgi:hypothetical protein
MDYLVVKHPKLLFVHKSKQEILLVTTRLLSFDTTLTYIQRRLRKFFVFT